MIHVGNARGKEGRRRRGINTFQIPKYAGSREIVAGKGWVGEGGVRGSLLLSIRSTSEGQGKSFDDVGKVSDASNRK